MNINELIATLKAIAIARYEDGWDTFVECYTDEDWRREIESLNATSEDKVIEFFEGIASIYRDRYADAINSAF